jgi:hypothetical protein
MKPARLLLLMLCLCPLAMYAQTAEVGGVVQDPSAAVIPKASVEFRNQDTGIRRQTTTNGSGVYHIDGVDPGKYDATIQAKGFKTLTRENIIFQVGDKAQIDFKMQVGSEGQTVTVDGSGSTINTTDASVSTVIDRKFVENIPLNGRSFQDLISMTAGVVTQNPQSGSGLAYNGDFSVNGQRTESNYYTVDGVTGNIASGNGYGQAQNGTGGSLGGSTALGTTQSLISVDALQEFRVQSSTYSAEYGRSPGGQFSLVTRSGTNSFHGSAFDYLRNNFFDANDWFNDYYGKPTPALRQNDFGGTLGGPVWIPKLYDGKNRTFFFFSYEGLRLTQPTAAAIQYVPDMFMRNTAAAAIRPILNAYPVPNGVDYGTSANPSLAQFIAPFSLPSAIDSTSLRADHTFGPKLSIFFRYGDTPSSTESRPAFARLETRISTQTYTFGATSQFSRTLGNEFRLGYDRNDASNSATVDDFGGATSINVADALGAGSLPRAYPVLSFNIPGIGSSLFQVPNAENIGRQWNIVDTLSASLGRHQFRFGLDYRRIKSALRPPDPLIEVIFQSAKSILNNTPDIPEIVQEVPSTPIFNETSVFAQDEWRLSPRLSLSMGLRWEVNPPLSEAHGNLPYTLLGNIGDPSSLALAPAGTPLWKTTWFNFAPRLGAAWTAIDRPGWETVIRAGGGVFYDNLNQVAASGYEGLGFLAYKVYAGASLPFSLTQLTFPIVVAPPYSAGTIYAFPAHLQLPYTLEWNTAVQQALGKKETVTISYVGANGRRLTGEQELSLGKINPNFGTVFYYSGHLTSNYQALQVQFQRSVSHGVQALASYTWAHSLDFGSTGAALPLMRGNSDFDVRNNFQGGLSWELSQIAANRVAKAILNAWALDGRVLVRSGFPVPLAGSVYVDPGTGNENHGELNLVPTQPLYLYGSKYPGGRIINQAAFSLPSSGIVGNAPRNFVRGFGAGQVNLAVRREFHLREGFGLQFRAEAFNVLNHPNFGFIDSTYGDATFGQATQTLNQSLGTVASQYQQGGPRSMQLALKLHF